MDEDTVNINIKCPLCGKHISGIFKKPKRGQLGRFAVDHGDHVVTIDYDSFGHVRCINAFRVFPIPSSGEILCQVCKRPIKIIKSHKQFYEYAYVHDDHVVIVYIFKKYCQLEIIPLIRLAPRPLRNIIDELISKWGIKKLSGMITYALIHNKILLTINETDIIKPLLLQLNSLKNTVILAGEGIQYEKFSNLFIESVLLLVRTLPSKDALKKLDDMLMFIINMAKIINKYNQINQKIVIDLVEKIPNKALRELILNVASLRKNAK